MNNGKKRARARHWKQRKQWESREPDMLRRAVGLPTDFELLKGDERRGNPVGIMGGRRA